MAKANPQCASPVKPASPAKPASPRKPDQDGLPVMLKPIAGVEMPVVSARHLYDCLGMERDFSAWINLLKFKPHAVFEQTESSKKRCAEFLKNGGHAQGLPAPLPNYWLNLETAFNLARYESSRAGVKACTYVLMCAEEIAAQQVESQPHQDGQCGLRMSTWTTFK